MDLMSRITNLNDRLAVIRDVLIQRSKLENEALKQGANLQEKLRLQHIAFEQRISQLAPLFARISVAPTQATGVAEVCLQGENQNYERSIQWENKRFGPTDDQSHQEDNPIRLQFDSDKDDFLDKIPMKSLNSFYRNFVEDTNFGQSSPQSPIDYRWTPNVIPKREKSLEQLNVFEDDEFTKDGESFKRAQVFVEHQQELDNVPEVFSRTYERRNTSTGGDSAECDTLVCESALLERNTSGNLLHAAPGAEVTLNLTLRLEPEGKVTGKYSCSRVMPSAPKASGVK